MSSYLKILFASQFPEESIIKSKAWELLTYYCYVALDCQTVYNKQSPRQMI